MRQRTEAARDALRAVQQGKIIDPGRYRALLHAGMVGERGKGHRARRWVTPDGEAWLAEQDA